MTNIERTIFSEGYSYRDFNFIIKIIQREWGIDGEGAHNDQSITNSKAFFDLLNGERQSLDNILKDMVNNIKESLRAYTDYEIGIRKPRRPKSYRQYRPKVKKNLMEVIGNEGNSR
mgnify:CR=1 FL=1